MSMMGGFREICVEVLRRLQADESLVRDVVKSQSGGHRAPAHLQEQVIAGMKKAIAESGDQLLPFLPVEQREKIKALRPEQQKAVFQSIAEQLAKKQGWDEHVARDSARPRVASDDLGPLLDIQKAWHGVHFLLTGTAGEAPGPLGHTILGGTPMGEDTGYGPPRVLQPEEVAQVAVALGGLSREALAGRYDAAALESAQVYPGGWEDPDCLAWLLDSFEEVRAFYTCAADHRAAVLLYIT